MSENDPLLVHLIELVKELDAERIPVILGGGMSLYLRLKFWAPETPRYPIAIQTRSTNDLDLFLTSRLIVDRLKMEALSRALSKLGYEVVPEAKNFQFFKIINLYGQAKAVKVDLLAPPPIEPDKAKVKIEKPRIKPIGVKGIHAYLTDAATGIEIGKQAVDVRILGFDIQLHNEILFLPSAYNYLILKLHAFDDRKNRSDERSDYGRHHAFDLFATVARMNEEDWAKALEHNRAEREEDYIHKTTTIVKRDFSRRTELGLVRLRESENYRRNAETYENYLEQFIKDLADLFP